MKWFHIMTSHSNKLGTGIVASWINILCQMESPWHYTNKLTVAVYTLFNGHVILLYTIMLYFVLPTFVVSTWIFQPHSNRFSYCVSVMPNVPCGPVIFAGGPPHPEVIDNSLLFDTWFHHLLYVLYYCTHGRSYDTCKVITTCVWMMQAQNL